MEQISVWVLHCGTITMRSSAALNKGILPGSFTKYPVSAYLIEHPSHGNILIDTGLSPSGISKFSASLMKLYKPECSEEETAAAQLRRMGIMPEDIDLLLLTHNDADHTCALEDFAGKTKRIVMSELEYFYSCRKVYKDRQCWDTWMPYVDVMEQAHFYGTPLGAIGRGYDVFGDDSVLCIASPGHTEGQVSVLVNKKPSWRFKHTGYGPAGSDYIVFAADSAFSHENIDTLQVPGYGFNEMYQKQCLQKLQEMKKDPLCKKIFCSHDASVSPGTYVF